MKLESQMYNIELIEGSHWIRHSKGICHNLTKSKIKIYDVYMYTNVIAMAVIQLLQMAIYEVIFCPNTTK
ncbi:hypothetical protein C0J52_27388 [Blattella germanica]|nr:hypothetical protein C0J52_27388 [Blattella germanica]